MIGYQFVKAKGLSSSVIAWWGGGFAGHGYSHVDCIMPNGSLIGARWDNIGGGRGVLARKPFYEVWIRRSIVWLPCTDKLAAERNAFVEKQIGDPYDAQAIWGFLKQLPLHSAGHWICSALAFASVGVAGAGIIEDPPVDSSLVTPDDCFLVLACLPGSKVQLDLNPTGV